MAEEQMLDYLESMISYNLNCELDNLRMKYSDEKFSAETFKKFLQDEASSTFCMMAILDDIKDKKAKLQNSSELADISDEALVQEIKDRGLEKYL